MVIQEGIGEDPVILLAEFNRERGTIYDKYWLIHIQGTKEEVEQRLREGKCDLLAAPEFHSARTINIQDILLPSPQFHPQPAQT